MADWFYGVNKGSRTMGSDISVATSTQSKDIELHVNTTNNPKKEDVIVALEQFRWYILSNGVQGSDPSSAKGGTDLPPL